MTLADIRAFVALAETGSINRAALHLGLTQPATTRRVQNFEASLRGAELLDRRVRPPVLTPAGREILAHCRRVLLAVAELEAAAARETEPIGELRLGISPGLAEAVLATPLDDLSSRFPALRLSISAQWTTPLIAAIAACELDCALALLTEHHALPVGIAGTMLGSESLCVVAPRDLAVPARSRRGLRLAALAGERWVLNPAGCGYREALLRACDLAKTPCRLAAEILGYELQLSLIARGAGLGIVPRRLLDKSPWRRQIRVIKVLDFAPKARVMLLRGASLGSLGAAIDYLQARIAHHKKFA